MKANKLKRINLKNSYTILPKYKIISVNMGNFVRISFFADGWYSYTFYGVCTRVYKTSNGHTKINLFNQKQKLNLLVNLNLNIFKSIFTFI